MSHYHHQERFKKLYLKALDTYRAGKKEKSKYFKQDDLDFIAANGWRAQDFFDYAEDQIRDGEPSYEIALSIEQVRRDYFLHIQNGQPSDHRISAEDLPAKKDALEGIEWLPRILPKAIGKLKGELPDEIMYCCGGDRNFLQTHDIHPAEFLRLIWAHMDDTPAILAFIKRRSPALATA